MTRPAVPTPASAARVPAPADILGFEVATRPARHHEILGYARAVAAVSDRVRLREYGQTAEGRALLEVIISSPENLGRSEETRRQVALLGEEAARPAGGAAPPGIPLSVWIGCGIHGDEISGPDAALTLLYRLAAGDDVSTRQLLDRLVVHLDVLANPDGRERFLTHVAAFGRNCPVHDPQDLLHNPFWPEGRGNHYLFDLNRDALFGVQAESRARIAAITAAQPQLYIDMHEMAAADTYLFAVPAEPLNPHLPAVVQESWRDLARDQAEAFDRQGASYYTRSWNEVFYPGYFDIWPAYHGAVPVLYEQSATSGSAVRLPNGKLRTYREAVDNQLQSAFANLATVTGAQPQFLARWVKARAAARAAPERHWLVPPGNPYKTRALLDILRAQGIAVERLEAAVQADDLHSMWQAGPLSAPLPAGTLRVRTRQSLGGLVRNLFDFHVPCEPEFVARERRGLDLGGKTSLFDVTAWSVAHAHGSEVYWTPEPPPGHWLPWADEPPATSAARTALRGARYGYLLQDASLHSAARLLVRGVRLRVATEAFVFDRQRVEAGTLLARNEDQDSGVDVAALLEEEARHGVAQPSRIDTARILEGPDLGGREYELLTVPRVGVLTGAFMSAPGTGAVWHLLDAAIGMPVTLLDFARLASYDLAPYNVLVFSDVGDAEGVASLLKSLHLESLKAWVQGGGTLIAMSGGAQAVAAAGLTTSRPRREVLEQYPPWLLGRPVGRMIADDFVGGAPGMAAVADDAAVAGTTEVLGEGARAFAHARTQPFTVPADAPTLAQALAGVASEDTLRVVGNRLRRYLPRGAYLRTDLKPSHWLRFGAPDRLPVLFRESDALVAGEQAELVGRFAAPRDLVLGGLVWPEAAGYVAGTAMLLRERIGRGQVVLFANDPLFRGCSLGTERLFLNAMLFGPALRGA